MKAQINCSSLIIIAIIFLSIHSCIPGPLPAISEDWLSITYKDSKGNILIDTVDNPATINYNDIVVSRVLPDGTIREFRGDSLPFIFLKNSKRYHPTGCVLITNGWLYVPGVSIDREKANGDYSGESSEVTTYIKLSDELPIDTIKVDIINLNKRYKAYRGVHGYTKVFLNGELVHERTLDEIIDGRNVCSLTITK